MTIVVAETKRVLYFGCIGGLGHYLHDSLARHRRSTAIDEISAPGFPWTISHLDTGLLKNGKHRDVYDGKVFWTCGGTPLWIAFYWWDNSVDNRDGSNSGFYVQGFDHLHAQDALDYAGSIYPEVIKRQRYPLVLS